MFQTPEPLKTLSTAWLTNLQDPLGLVPVLKGPYADHILIPRAQPEVVYFLVSDESPYFSNYKSEISPSNSL